MQAAIRDVRTPDIASRLQSLQLEEALHARRHAAMRELCFLIKDKQRAPMTYDPLYTAGVQRTWGMKTRARLRALIDEAKVQVNFPDGSQDLANPEVLMREVQDLQEPDMEKYSAEDALDSQLPYYQLRHSIYIEHVTA